ncbi:MAG: ATP-binding protein [Chloroflexota bacterium]
MRSASDADSAGRSWLNSDLDELRGQVLDLALWSSVGLVAFLHGTLVFSAPFRFERLNAALLLVAIIVIVILLVWLTHRVRALAGLKVASAVLLVGLGLVLVAYLLIDPSEHVLFWFALLVLLAQSLLGARAMLVATALAMAIFALFAGPLGRVAYSEAAAAALFTGVSAVVAWIGSRPLYVALNWSWRSYTDANEKAEQLKDRQGEILHTLRMLQLTKDQLERANRELARAREVAEEARRLKAQFAANVSHELRTPLNHIIGFADVMINAPETYGTPLPEIYREDVEAIHRSAQHLSNLIGDVLDLSQIEAGRMGLVKENVNVAEVVREAVGVTAGILRARHLGLVLELAENIPQLYLDRTRIRQVLINLLSNAARFTARGQVTVSARLEAYDLVLSVRDTGIGISSEGLTKVFDEFRQLDSSTSRRHGGTGLGLAICKRFVELHGGRISVESTPGEGSTFSFSLPLHSGDFAREPWQALRSENPTVVAEPAADRSIGVVTDDPALLHLIKRQLDGFNVVGVRNQQQLMSLAQELSLHAVMATAHSLPEGLRNLERLRGTVAHVPTVSCCFAQNRGGQRRSVFSGYLTKPVLSDGLREQLRQLGKRIKKILIVDDEPDTVRLLTRMLRAMSVGYRIARAGSGEEALALMQQWRPDVVLLDLALPGMSGYDLAEQMRADRTLQRVHVIAVTARDDLSLGVLADGVFLIRGDGLRADELLSGLKENLKKLMASPGSAQERAATPAG